MPLKPNIFDNDPMYKEAVMKKMKRRLVPDPFVKFRNIRRAVIRAKTSFAGFSKAMKRAIKKLRQLQSKIDKRRNRAWRRAHRIPVKGQPS
jgi:3-methyladenine DNA glycosylase AlkD